MNLHVSHSDAEGRLYANLHVPQLYEAALARGEATLAHGGALVADTGAHTGRAAQDKFIVRDWLTENAVWWERTQAMTAQQFEQLRADMFAAARRSDLFAQDLYAGADPAHRLKVRVYAERAWHALFIRNLLIRPPEAERAGFAPELTILCAPSFRADPERHGCRSETVIAMDFNRGLALIGGTAYAGEIKKAVFTYLNFLLPRAGVLPMHCAVNRDARDGAAIFFGLSGTGKTTLSADSSRELIGDDEHGWGEGGLFNFEGGCYAKAIRLSAQAEPEIHAAAQRFGAVLENVVLHPETRAPDFDDDRRTENTRIAYPLDFIRNAATSGRAEHPRHIVMLACDAFGVLPPIARLDPAQAMVHFLSGYTAKVAGVEGGVREPQATFSACFGAPFMPRHPAEYGRLLREMIDRHHVNCWLVNTGWSGGGYGVGARMPIETTRALVRAALGGALARAPFSVEPWFGLAVPREAPGVDPALLDPAKSWAAPQDYEATAQRLVAMFRDNFKPFAPLVDRETLAAQPLGKAA